jgi:hypothetical protein
MAETRGLGALKSRESGVSDGIEGMDDANEVLCIREEVKRMRTGRTLDCGKNMSEECKLESEVMGLNI